MPCPICLGALSVEFFTKGARKLLICESCRHICWDLSPPESELHDYYKRQYTGTHSQETVQAEARDYFRGHLRDLLRLIGKSAQDCAIVDYGCSIPVLLAEAQKAGFRRAVGIDFADESRNYAGGGVEVLSPYQIDRIEDNSIDMVRFSHVLEHSADPVSVLRGILGKVRPGGLIYITQPNFPVFRLATSSRDLKDTVYPEHLHFFSPISLLELTRRVDLEVRQFFTHQDEEAVFSRFEDMLDLEYAKLRLAVYELKGDSFFPPLSNYPYYCGENSVLYAFKLMHAMI